MRKILIASLITLIICAGLSLAGEIHTAAQTGDLKIVKKMISDYSELIDSRNDSLYTPLIIAAANGHFKIVKFLVSEGADINLGDRENTSALQNATLAGHEKIVKYLLSQGADINHVDTNGMNALQWAAYRGQTNMVKLLHENGLDINSSKPSGSTALHGAAFGGYLETTKYLVESGADINAANDYGYTPFLSACANGQQATAEYLLEVGSDLNGTTVEGETVLHMAAGSGNIEFAKMLIDKGIDVNVQEKYGRTPIYPAIWRGQLEMVKFLIENGADVNQVSEGGSTPLFSTVYADNLDFARVLIENGANINVYNDDNCSPLFFAVLNGYKEFSEYLLSKGAEVNFKEKNCGKTPLHLASIKGYFDIAKMLVDNGASIDEKDNDGKIPLYHAGKYGHKNVAGLLISEGSRLDEMPRNFGKCESLEKPLITGEACLWYTGHCGWAIRTKNHFMIFDYWKRGGMPEIPLLANGCITPDEIGNQNITVFVTHEHQDHFDPRIFDWADKVKNINYVFGFEAEAQPQFRTEGYNGPQYTYTAPRTSSTIDGMEITAIDANDAGVGFLVKVDGVEIYHAGDHAGWLPDQKQGFTDEIDFLADKVGELDFAFVNVTGCHVRDKDALREGNYYTINKLNPQVVIPTHALNWEHEYKIAADRAKEDGIEVEFFCPANCGDSFHYTRDKTIEISGK